MGWIAGAFIIGLTIGGLTGWVWCALIIGRPR